MTKEEFSNLLRIGIRPKNAGSFENALSTARLVEFHYNGDSCFAIVYNEETGKFQNIPIIGIERVFENGFETEKKPELEELRNDIEKKREETKEEREKHEQEIKEKVKKEVERGFLARLFKKKERFNKAITEGGISGNYETKMKDNKSEEREYYGGC